MENNNNGIDLNVEPNSGVLCSICLDLVNYGSQRSRAKLQCGHEFHLDCIGSAFNMKGAMQCPNCRETENGQWLFASGSTNSTPEFNMDDVAIDNNPFYYSFPEMPYICPFHGSAQGHLPPESTLGMMSGITPMANHQHPGWPQFGPFQYTHPLSGLPLSLGHGSGRFDGQRSLPRFVQPGQVYEPGTAFSPFVENPPVNYSHSWVSDNLPHFPFQ